MGSRLIRTVLVSLLGGVMLTVGAAPASAGVIREPVPSGFPVTLPAGEVCTFQVTLEEVEADLVATTFPNGTLLVTGPLIVEVINDETGESVVRDISGPALITQDSDGTEVFRAFGNSLSVVREDATGEVGSGLIIGQGLLVFRDDVLTRVVGPTEDLCETLAA